jgi:glycerol uptake facilitator protein
MQERGPAAYVAEFIGTFILVFFIGAVIALYVTPATPQQPVQPFIDWSVIGLVHLLVLFVIVQTLAVVSGAHVNPAVTLAMTLLRQIRLIDSGIYITCQLAGGVLGALLVKALLMDEGRGVHYGAVTVSQHLGNSAWLGFLAEAIGTFVLVWAVLGVALNPTASKDWSGLVIGGALALIVLVLGPLTGAGVNPARAFGPAIVGHEFDGAGRFLLAYVLGPIIGSGLATAGYFALYMLPGAKGPRGAQPVG